LLNQLINKNIRKGLGKYAQKQAKTGEFSAKTCDIMWKTV